MPNSAIFLDNDGKPYVYTLSTENSPLGARYYLERTPVTVLASDDVRTAIEPDPYQGTDVVTYAEVTLEKGMQVRIER